MSSLFKDSAVLTRDTIGASYACMPRVPSLTDSRQHTSLSGTSHCTDKAVRNYFRDGVLPGPGTVCDDITDALFGNQTATTKRAMGSDDPDAQVLKALEVLSKTRLSRAFGGSV